MHLESADPDLPREMVSTFAHQLMNAEVDAINGAGYGERSDDRVNRRNGHRDRRSSADRLDPESGSQVQPGAVCRQRGRIESAGECEAGAICQR